jgi:hypothetical protein
MPATPRTTPSVSQNPALHGCTRRWRTSVAMMKIATATAQTAIPSASSGRLAMRSITRSMPKISSPHLSDIASSRVKPRNIRTEGSPWAS